MKKTDNGYSLIEMLITISLFGVLSIMVTQIIISTVRSAQKSESIARVKDDLDYTLSIIEKNIRNADAISTCTNQLEYKIDNNLSNFTCSEGANGYYINWYNSASALDERLTSRDIKIEYCQFICFGTMPNITGVEVKLTGVDLKSTIGGETKVSVQTKIFLRNRF